MFKLFEIEKRNLGYAYFNSSYKATLCSFFCICSQLSFQQQQLENDGS